MLIYRKGREHFMSYQPPQDPNNPSQYGGYGGYTPPQTIPTAASLDNRVGINNRAAINNPEGTSSQGTSNPLMARGSNNTTTRREVQQAVLARRGCSQMSL